jgi:hypothetical protein
MYTLLISKNESRCADYPLFIGNGVHLPELHRGVIREQRRKSPCDRGLVS